MSLRLLIIGYLVLGFGLKGYLLFFFLYGDVSCILNFGMGFLKILLYRLILMLVFGFFKRKWWNMFCLLVYIDVMIDLIVVIVVFFVSLWEVSLFSILMVFLLFGMDLLSGFVILYFFILKWMKGLSINEIMFCLKLFMLVNVFFFVLVFIVFILFSLCLSVINFFIVVLFLYVDWFVYVFFLLFF